MMASEKRYQDIRSDALAVLVAVKREESE